jgi:predicted outer membrane repeat protein
MLDSITKSHIIADDKSLGAPLTQAFVVLTGLCGDEKQGVQWRIANHIAVIFPPTHQLMSWEGRPMKSNAKGPLAHAGMFMLNILLLAALLAGSAFFPTRVQAGGGGGITIETLDDNVTPNGYCSLREALVNSNNNAATYLDCGAGVTAHETLQFAAGLSGTISLGSSLPAIIAGNYLTIDGSDRITINGNTTWQVFLVNSTARLNLLNLTITQGHANIGGALYNNGTTNIARVTFSNNSSVQSGGAIANASTLTVARSTFTGNNAGADGGGVNNATTSANATISNSTFANNSANYGGGVMNNSGMINILSSTFSGNTALASSGFGGALTTWNGQSGIAPNTYIHNTILANSVGGVDCYNVSGGLLVGSNNLVESTTSCLGVTSLSSDPLLGALKGKPAYFPLKDASPAINAGDDDYCAGPPVSGTSQNGAPRPQGAHCDIGSVEASIKLVFKSAGAADGWVLESSATSSLGGSMDSAGTTLRVGDDAMRKQYRSILSFTTSGVPDNAVITDVKLKVKLEGYTGTGDPLTSMGGLKADVRKGPFGLPTLQTSDFQAVASKTVGPLFPTPVSFWYTINLTNAKGYINKLITDSGVTQVRLRFTLGDDGNSTANHMRLHSGNALMTNDRPQLIIYYYLP